MMKNMNEKLTGITVSLSLIIEEFIFLENLRYNSHLYMFFKFFTVSIKY